MISVVQSPYGATPAARTLLNLLIGANRIYWDRITMLILAACQGVRARSGG